MSPTTCRKSVQAQAVLVLKVVALLAVEALEQPIDQLDPLFRGELQGFGDQLFGVGGHVVSVRPRRGADKLERCPSIAPDRAKSGRFAATRDELRLTGWMAILLEIRYLACVIAEVRESAWGISNLRGTPTPLGHEQMADHKQAASTTPAGGEALKELTGEAERLGLGY
jgi:hypothetical protein